MGRKRLGVSRICVVCGTGFYKPPSHVAKWPALTCSRTCAARHFRDKGEFVDCAHCGKSFYPQPNQVRKGYGRYCSHACFHATRDNQLDRVCLQCGKPFRGRSLSGNCRRRRRPVLLHCLPSSVHPETPQARRSEHVYRVAETGVERPCVRALRVNRTIGA